MSKKMKGEHDSIIGEYKEHRTFGQRIKQNLKSIKYAPDYMHSGVSKFIKTNPIKKLLIPSSRVSHSSMGKRISTTQKEADKKRNMFMR